MLNIHTLTALLADTFTTVHVSFNNNNPATYTYKTRLQLQAGDTVVVPVGKEAAYRLATVAYADNYADIDYNAIYPYSWVIAKVDDTAYKAQLEKEAEMLRLIKQRIADKQKSAVLCDLLQDTELSSLIAPKLSPNSEDNAE
jgi:hypothetical protein